MEIETLILKSLTSNEEFCRKTVPFLKPEYFDDKSQRIVYLIADSYFRKYNKVATPDVLAIELDKAPGLSEQTYKEATQLISSISNMKVEGEYDWVVENTEKFCQDRAIYLGIRQCISIMDGEEKKLSKEAIPEILKEALAVSFDSVLGHDYEADAENQFEYYTSPHTKIPFNLDKLNDVTNGGVTRKTLNLLIAATHGCKTLALCDLAASYYMQGYNVLYITMEESENKIRQRIDANLLNVVMDDLMEQERSSYLNRVKRVTSKTKARMVIREYPTSGASVANFRYLMHELLLKQDFKPDIIMVDYLNLCLSSRFKSADNSYAYHKAISEELRGFAKEADVALWSATQLNRDGFKTNDPDMGQVSDSFGVAFTADFACILISSDELVRMAQILFKQQKNRYKDLNYCKRFVVGIERAKMKLYDVEDSAQPPPDIDDDEDYNANLKDKAQRFKNFQ